MHLCEIHEKSNPLSRVRAVPHAHQAVTAPRRCRQASGTRRHWGPGALMDVAVPGYLQPEALGSLAGPGGGASQTIEERLGDVCSAIEARIANRTR